LGRERNMDSVAVRGDGEANVGKGDKFLDGD